MSDSFFERAIPSDSALLHRRLAHALFAFASRFVPIPLVDDLARARVFRSLVESVTRSHAPSEDARALDPLFERQDGCLLGCLLLGGRLVVKLLLLPIRAVANVVFGSFYLARDLVEVLLLAAVTEELLRDLPSHPPETRRAWLVKERRAFDRALDAMDFGVVRAVLGSALAPVRKLGLRALALLPRFARTDTTSAAPGAEAIDRDISNEELGLLVRALRSEEIARFVAQFEARWREERTR